MSAPRPSANAPAPPAVQVVGVHRTFDPDTAPVRALRGADLTVEHGEFVALTGPSGSGKSTLLQVIAGLDRPDSGAVRLAGTALDDLSDDELAVLRRRHIGFVFQFFRLLDSMTALENVALAAMIAGAGRAAAQDRGWELLDMLGLLDKSASGPAALSGGQRQRLAIARALANRPTVLVADEPTGALDSAGATEILELFQRLNAAGQTILLVTHSAEVAAGAGRRVAMRDGRLETVADAPVAG